MQAVQHCSDMCRLLKARILSCSWQPITSPRWNSYLHFLLPSNEEWNVFSLLCRHDDDRSMFMSKREKCCWYQMVYKSWLPGRTKLAQRSPPVTACTEPGSNISARWADKTFSSGLDRKFHQKTIFYQKFFCSTSPRPWRTVSTASCLPRTQLGGTRPEPDWDLLRLSPPMHTGASGNKDIYL